MLRKLIESFTRFTIHILFATISFEYMYVVCTLVNKLQKNWSFKLLCPCPYRTYRISVNNVCDNSSSLNGNGKLQLVSAIIFLSFSNFKPGGMLFFLNHTQFL